MSNRTPAVRERSDDHCVLALKTMAGGRGHALRNLAWLASAWMLAGAALGQSWIQTGAPVAMWAALACSADGTRLAAVVRGGGIFTSSDRGATWHTTDAPEGGWSSVAMSADGSVMVAAAGGSWLFEGVPGVVGAVYRSEDFGQTWLQTPAPVTNWWSVALSGDGRRAVGVVNGGGIYISTDSAKSWSMSSAPLDNWVSVAASADGTKIIAVRSFRLTTSLDGGLTWLSAAAPWYFRSVASSADGRLWLAGCMDMAHNVAPTFLSTDLGARWEESNQGLFGPAAVACSADGLTLAAASAGGAGPFGSGPGVIELSTDAGLHWTSTAAPGTNWIALASSADGAQLLAAVQGGGIYRWRKAGVPRLALTRARSAGQVSIVWTVPSREMTLQQSSDLQAQPWTDFPAEASLNTNSLQNEVTVAPAGGQAFYRLKSLSPE